jgi:peptidoglycan/LPS O-acetylase OafA/YrhL
MRPAPDLTLKTPLKIKIMINGAGLFHCPTSPFPILSTGTMQEPVLRQPASTPALALPVAADGQEIRPLTGVRAFAALWVVLLHFHAQWALLMPGLSLGQTFAQRGSLGVDVFFILSGFILSYVYLADKPELSWARHRRFLWLRIARIYPVHVFTFGSLALLVLGARLLHIHIEGEYPLNRVPFELTMTHAWWWFLEPGGWNYPSWSISAEWFAYLVLFPLSAWVLRRRWKTPALLVIAYAALLTWLTLMTGNVDGRRLSRVSCEFLAGAMAFGIFRQNPQFTRLCQRSATTLVGVVLVIAASGPASALYPFWLLVLLFPLMLVGLTADGTWVGRFLGSPAVVWGGRVSYSLYMTHALTQKLLKVLLPSAGFISSSLPVRCGVVLAQLALLIAAAALLYYAVEVPARDAIRRWVSRPRSTARPARLAA